MSHFFEISEDDKEILQKTILQSNFKQEKVSPRRKQLTFKACINMWCLLYQENGNRGRINRSSDC
jgi:hypothetical protein